MLVEKTEVKITKIKEVKESEEMNYRQGEKEETRGINERKIK